MRVQKTKETYDELFGSMEQISHSLTRATTLAEVHDLSLQYKKKVELIESKKGIFTPLVNFLHEIAGEETQAEKLERKIIIFEREQINTIIRINLATEFSFTSLAEIFNLTKDRKELHSQLEITLLPLPNDLSEITREHFNRQLTKIDEIENDLSQLIKRVNQRQVSNPSQVTFDNFSIIAKKIDEMESTLLALPYAFSEEKIHLSYLKPLIARYELAILNFKELQSVVSDQWLGKPRQFGINLVRFTKIAGIRNGGNTCYLASAVQALNNVPPYRKAFDPENNPLQKRPGELPYQFDQRQAIQSKVFKMIEEINKGITIETHKINQLRKACYEYINPEGARITDTLNGTADSAEVLERMLDAMDYRSNSYQYQTVYQPSGNFQIVEADPEEYNSWDMLNKVENGGTARVVTIYNYMGQSVPLQTLIDESWEEEQLQMKVKEQMENGDWVVKEYEGLTKKIEPLFDQVPEVLRISVQQIEEVEATIEQPRKIYPFGNNRGPLYELKSIIEHQPGHYVAYVVDEKGSIILTNDGVISKSHENQKGLAYYYVLAPQN